MCYYRVIIITNDRNPNRAVRGGSCLTLDEAQAICRDPQTSSSTPDPSKPGYPGVNIKALNRRAPNGWFVGYERQTCR